MWGSVFSTHVVGVEQGRGDFNSGGYTGEMLAMCSSDVGFSRNHKMDSGTNT